MDTDLFQILALILLLGLLLTLFGVLQSLGAIRKTLEGQGAPEPSATPAVEPVAAAPPREASQEPETWARGDATEPETSGLGDTGARTGWPAPQEAAGAPTSTVEETSPAPAAGSGARVLYGDAGLTTATPSEAALRPAEDEPADTTAAASAGAAGSGMAGTMGLDSGVGTSGTTGGGTDAGTVGGLETGLGGSHMGTSGTSGTAGTDAGSGFGTVETGGATSDTGGGTTGVGAATTDTSAGTGGGGAVTERAASAEDDPQEQPFERDGRWWFRRGDELLVY
ncbi:MAG TPA: hypothetical protein VEV43_02755, partial [Actinomycetota bacterium]|nr:hypothetical protein [Actinomycetota bacterium]